MAPVPLQQVQFVPCMCPVTVSIAAEAMANKRSDEFSGQTSSAESAPVQSSSSPNVLNVLDAEENHLNQ